MTTIQLERRLAAVEKQLAALAAKTESPATLNSWIDEIHGTFQNDATYKKAARLGRQWRQAAKKPSGKSTRP